MCCTTLLCDVLLWMPVDESIWTIVQVQSNTQSSCQPHTLGGTSLYDTITPMEAMLEDYCHSISIWNEADPRIPGSVWQKAVTGVWTKSSLSDNFWESILFKRFELEMYIPLYTYCASSVHLYITWPDGSSMLESSQKKRASLKSKQTKQQDMCNFLCMFHLTPRPIQRVQGELRMSQNRRNHKEAKVVHLLRTLHHTRVVIPVALLSPKRLTKTHFIGVYFCSFTNSCSKFKAIVVGSISLSTCQAIYLVASSR